MSNPIQPSRPLTVGSPLVCAILAKSGGKKRRAKTTRGPKTICGSIGDETVSLFMLLAAKKMAESLGGLDNAKAALDVLAELV